MPTVEVPDVGEIDFPDSMSQEDIQSALAKKFPPKLTPERASQALDVGLAQSTAIPSQVMRTLELGAPGAEMGRRQLEIQRQREKLQQERAGGDLREKALGALQAGVGTVAEMEPLNLLKRTMELPGQLTGSPYKIQPLVTPEQVGNFLFPTAEEAGSLSAGVRQAGSEFVSGLSSPDQAAALASGNPELVGRLFQTKAASQIPQAVQQLQEAVRSGDKTEIGKAGTALVATAAIPATIEAGIRTSKAGPEIPDYTGRNLETPAGAPAPKAEVAPALETVSPEQAAAAAKAMSRTATAAFEPSKAPKAEVPATPPEPERNLTMAAEAQLERNAMIEKVRQAGAKTTRQVKALFPEMNNQQAAILRDEAAKAPPSGEAGGAVPTTVEAISEVTRLFGKERVRLAFEEYLKNFNLQNASERVKSPQFALFAKNILANEPKSLAAIEAVSDQIRGGERVAPSGESGVPQPSAGPIGATVEAPVPAGETPQAMTQGGTVEAPRQVGNVTKGVTERPQATTSDILGFIETQADKARARLKANQGKVTFGSGPLHELPNIRDYAIIGAAKIARGAVDFARWSGDMIREFGEAIKPHLENLYTASQGLLKEHTGVVERVRQVLKEAELPEKAITKGITGQVGRSIEAGAESGERLAKAEVAPKLQALTQQLSDSIPKAEALSTYFEGQEKGGAAGRKAATKELKLADRWLEADANRVRDSLNEVAKGLPLEERGRFLKAISNATKRPPLVGGDPASMYRNAAQVAARIADRVDEVHKADTINEIKDTVSKALKSPSVDIGYKNKILDAIGRMSFTKPTAETVSALKSTRDYLARMEAQGKDVEMPKEVLDSLEVLSKTPAKEMPINVLEAIRDRVNMLDQLGRLKVKSRQEAWNIEKASKTRELVNEKTNPLETRPEFQPQPGEKRTVTMKVRNWMNRTMNMGTVFDRAILPIDALFELLGDAKGTYKGWLFKNVRNPLDLDYNAAQVMRDRLIAPVERLIKDNKMGEREAQRIGVYAEAQQDGGLERMVAQGVKPETISKILGDITPQEISVYRAMRQAMDSTLPEMQKLMQALYNIEVKPVENYFPMQRAWDLYEPEPQGLKQPKFGQSMEFDDLAGWKQMLGDYLNPKTTKTNRGFTMERQPGAETPIKLNAFDVFHSHINDVAYLLKTQRDLKMIGEMVRDDTFAQKYGKLGQTVVNNWLDTVARQGKVNASQKWLALDELRRRTSAGVIGFRLASQFVHLSNVPLGMWRTGGPGWYYAGLREALSPEGQRFLKENFAETFTRGGGEPAITEASEKATTIGGKTIIPKSVNKAGFAVARGIDRYNAQSIVLGTYLRLLKEKGVDFNRYDEIPVDKEAQAQALVLSRRAVASPISKDVSQQLSRGALTGGNVSIGRTLMQFQNIFQDQWSNIRVDLARSGIYEKNPRLAATAFISLLAMGLAEMGIRETSKQAINAITGYKPKKERDIAETLMLEGARRIPLGGQIASELLYGETGIPVIDSIVDVFKSVHTMATAKKPATQDKAAIGAISGVAQLGGVAGASQAGELLKKAY